MEPWSGLLEAMVRIAVPILFAVIGEIVAERSGVLNVGLEGMMLAGAFGAFTLAWITGSPAAGLVAGILAALVLAAIFALCVVQLSWEPIVTGVALNVLALGVTGVAFRGLTSTITGSLAVPTWPACALPGLARLPIVGPALFAQNVLGYAAFALAGCCAIFLSRTTAGLVVRAAGENPEAVETAGVDVRRVRTLATLFGGACAGAAGAYLATGYSNTFVEGMTAGRGFVALAIVVFARWRPALGVLGAFLFGLAMSLQVRLQGRSFLAIEIPYQFFQALPYALTLVVLARSTRRGAGAPAALARPFRRER